MSAIAKLGVTMAPHTAIMPVKPQGWPSLPVLSPGLSEVATSALTSSYGAVKAEKRDKDAVPDYGFRLARRLPDPTPEQIVEARAALAHYVALQRPDFALIERWLKGLNASVNNSQGEAAFNVRFAAYGSLLAEYPAQVFTLQTLQDAQRTFDFFPGTKLLTDFLDKHLRVIKDTEAALRRVASFQDPAEEHRQPASPEEHESVRILMQAFRSEQAERAVATGEPVDRKQKPVVKAYHLNDAERLAVAEKDARLGVPGAAFRVDFLRQKLAAQEAADAWS